MKKLRQAVGQLVLSGAILLAFGVSDAQTTNRSYAIGLDPEAKAVLLEIQQRKKRIDEFVITANNNWIIVAEDEVHYSNASYFEKFKGSGNRSLKEVLDQYIAETRTIDAIAVSSRSNWIVVSGRKVDYSSTSAFDSLGLRPRLEALIQEGKIIQSISLGSERRWVIVAGGRGYGGNLPAEMAKALDNALYEEQRFIKSASFRPGRGEWLVLADYTYWASEPIYHRIDKDFNRFRRSLWSVDHVVLGPNNDATLVSNFRVQLRPAELAARLEMQLQRRSGATTTLWQAMKAERVPGVAIAIIEDNKIHSIRGYGRLAGDKGYVAHDTIFSVASMSKAIGALGMLIAVEEGHISLDETPFDVAQDNPGSVLDQWIEAVAAIDGDDVDADEEPDWSDYEARIQAMTLNNLLTHTAGLNRWGIGLFTPSAGVTRRDILMAEKKYRSDGILRPLEGPPGQQRVYSGGGFTVAELMTEFKSGEPYERFMEDRILKPLGMNSSTFGELSDEQMRRLADGYLVKNYTGRLQQQPYKISPGNAAGGLYSTAEDYAKFVLALVNGGKARADSPTRIASEQTIRQLFMPAVSSSSSLDACNASSRCGSIRERCIENQCRIPFWSGTSWRGSGIDINSQRGSDGNPASIWHGGRQKGYRGMFWAAPDRKLGIVILTNGDDEWRTIVPFADKNANQRAQGNCGDSDLDLEPFEECVVRGASALIREILDTFASIT